MKSPYTIMSFKTYIQGVSRGVFTNYSDCTGVDVWRLLVQHPVFLTKRNNEDKNDKDDVVQLMV